MEWNGFPWSVYDMRCLWKVLCDEVEDSQSYGVWDSDEGRRAVALAAAMVGGILGFWIFSARVSKCVFSLEREIA